MPDSPVATQPATGAPVLSLRNLRLASGLTLLAYTLVHLLNHALGLVSLRAMEALLALLRALWHSPPGTVLLFGALLIHVALGLVSFYRRHTLRMPAWEAVQLITGLLIPPLLLGHVIGTRVADNLFGLEAVYARVVHLLWVVMPLQGLKQIALLTVVWLHGCIGLHFWLRIRPWYPRIFPWLIAVIVVVPLLAVLGFVAAGREVAALASGASAGAALAGTWRPPGADEAALLRTLNQAGLVLFGGTLAIVFGWRAARWGWARRHGWVHVCYPGGERVAVLPGASVLEASRAAGIPHASVCGGRARCTTCRVRVGAGAEHLGAPSEAEQAVLTRINAPLNVRLACQLRPLRDLEVTPLLPATVAASGAASRDSYVQGSEREVAILFADLRGSTELIEQRLPYDVVFVLNRFFAALSDAVERAGGHFAQFSGDGMMALFGIREGVGSGARRAMLAARYMHENLAALNRSLAGDLEAPLRMGIGIHAGLAIVGAMGNPREPTVTAIGDAVNVAARLEALTKELGCELLISEPAARHGGLDLDRWPRQSVHLRGRVGELEVRVVGEVDALPASAPGSAGGSPRN